MRSGEIRLCLQRELRPPGRGEIRVHVSASTELRVRGGDARQQMVFHVQNASSERRRVITGEHGNRPLRDDAALIVLVAHHVYGHAGHGCAGVEDCLVHSLAVHPLAAKRREQGGVHVEDTVPESRHHGRQVEQGIPARTTRSTR